jgi:hypothetical protein
MINKELLKTIVIVGAGNLGRRHFQALLKLHETRHFYIIDPFEEALDKARSIEKENNRGTHRCQYLSNLTELSIEQVDFAVLATNSNERLASLKEIVGKATLKYILFEKVLFPREMDYLEAAEILRKIKSKSWVNCPKRMLPEFRKIRNYFYQKGPTVFSAIGNMWQLGCNGIHTYDLFAFLTGDREIEFQTDLLDSKILSSKRDGYIEFTGSMYGQSSRGNFIQMTSTSMQEGRLPAVYTIANEKAQFIVHRGVQSHYDYALAEENWKWQRGKIITPYQSELTQLIVEELEAGREPSLPGFNESAQLHLQLIKAFNSHLDKVGFHHRSGECMIT